MYTFKVSLHWARYCASDFTWMTSLNLQVTACGRNIFYHVTTKEMEA